MKRVFAMYLLGLTVASLCSCSTTNDSTSAEKPVGETSAEPRAATKSTPESESEAGGKEQAVLSEDARNFTFVYEATIEPGEDEGPVDIFLPVAKDTPQQKITDIEVVSPVPGEFETEPRYGNRYWHARLDTLPEEPLTIQFVYSVKREPFSRKQLFERASAEYPEGARAEHALYLAANSRVPISGEIINQVLPDVGLTEGDTPLVRARKIYEFVVDTMEYKKVGEGWGNGDTFWACSQKYGNCTDFHALFTSLARHQGIPARFEIGFPVPTDRESGEIGGYHCWVQFYLPEVGWTPIDASEAKKHPEMRDLYFGSHPPNRIHFSTGRDLKLGVHHDSRPLNYFVYPLVEVGDEVYEGVRTKFSYSSPG